jgi:hypothetical protein
VSDAGQSVAPQSEGSNPWHALTLASDEAARVQLTATADALLAWSLVIPLFQALRARITYRVIGSSE